MEVSVDPQGPALRNMLIASAAAQNASKGSRVTGLCGSGRTMSDGRHHSRRQ
ncbi:MAG: hypothetical protein ABI361_12380 [Nitrososphaera sp.]